MEKTVNKIAWYSLLTLITVVIIGVSVFTKKDIQQAVSLGGGVATYNASTTPPDLTNVDKVLKTSSGIFGGIIITTAGNQVFDVYNATTTNIGLRTGNVATSSILLASFPANASVGEYHFDTGFNYGLLIDVTAGTLGTSTVLWE